MAMLRDPFNNQGFAGSDYDPYADQNGSSFWYAGADQPMNQPDNGGGQPGGMAEPAPYISGALPPGGHFDPIPGDNSPGIPGSSESPRERKPEEPNRGSTLPGIGAGMGGGSEGPAIPQSASANTISPPSIEALMGGGGGAQATPQRPSTPTPMAGAVSFPSGPASYDPSGQGAPPSGPSTPFRAPTPYELVGGHQNALLGKSGGLLGGGIGVPGQMGKGEQDPSELLAMLASLMNKG